MITTKARNLIGGNWHDSSQQFKSMNPACTKEIIGTAPIADSNQVHQAVQAARDAFEIWRDLGWVQRAQYIDKLAQLIKRDLEEIGVLVTRECGKPINEGRADAVEALHMTQYAASLGRFPTGLTVSSEVPEKDAYILRKPKGVVACISPWNFPIAIPMWEMMPSLVAGNTVVFKPAEQTSICGHKLAELFLEAGFPDGVINVVHGPGEITGDAMVKHQDVDVVIFTGSLATGKMIQQTAAKDLYKFATTEMGGKNAVIVLDDADLKMASNIAVLSCFKTTGQRCVSAGRLIVDQKIEPKFTEMFLEKTKRIQIGDGLDENTFMGPLINQEGVEKWHRHNNKAIEEGAEVLLHGKELKTGKYADGYFVEPFVYRFAYQPSTFCLREQAFSPHVAIIPVNGMEEAVKVYNDTNYGLSMSVVTEDFRKWRWVRDHAEFGLGYVNLPSIGAEIHLPFGGVKASGNGHPSAEGLLDSVTHRVAFTINNSHELVMAQGLSTII